MTKTKTPVDIQKCYNIMITGKVQDIGFRMLIEDIARLDDLKGYAFNDIDGSVKIVCCGETGIIDEFLDEIRFRGIQKGAIIDDIAKEEITQRIFLPQRFLRLYTDELADIGRKLDAGIEVLKSIKGDTSALVIEMREHNKEQREYNQWMKEHLIKMDEYNKDHNKRLDKILEKLAEK